MGGDEEIAAAEEEEEKMVKIGAYGGRVRMVSSLEDGAAEEMLLLWGIQQPTLSKPNTFVSQSSLQLRLDACGRSLSILQSPCSLSRRSSAMGLTQNVLDLMRKDLQEMKAIVENMIEVSKRINESHNKFTKMSKGVSFESDEKLLECQEKSSIEILDFVVDEDKPSDGTPGVTGAVLWDSGVVLGKFVEHAVESGMMVLRGKKVVELGSGCGLVGCIAALLGAEVILTDLPDRLRLLKKNIETNLDGDFRGSAAVNELIWGEELDTKLIEPLPDYDVIYSEGAVMDLLATLRELCGTQTTVILAGELRNDSVLEYFLESASKEFIVGRVDQGQWHPDYCSPRVVIYVLVKR
ncbi:S-adenosyl-L-methionine-dependent methyltransferases superfamily protein [Actinidia rufa]|uniref:S-adenosyl-L-methionine-dependent methyltransferases superfamily protein n=1 Tax=Actinidia rufa TaxID=165716 RepID=A0A7J0DT18_9ERIC|nr:S-adenosyl-L-methionine-dependent methyltransferases superfamily protein [Actinidia rufa]